MYMGAMTTRIQGDDGVVGFMKQLSGVANQQARSGGEDTRDSEMGGKDGLPPHEMQQSSVAFMVLSTTMNSVSDMTNARNNIGIIKDSKTTQVDRAGKDEEGNIVWKLSYVENSKYSVLCFIYHKHNQSASASSPVVLGHFYAKSPQDAIRYLHDKSPIEVIPKIAILGYNLLRAGLTVQTSAKRGASDISYLVQYVMLHTDRIPQMNEVYQMAGRAFAELQGRTRPSLWKIHVLSSASNNGTVVNKMIRYAALEDRLAHAEPATVLEVLRKQVFLSEQRAIKSNPNWGRLGAQKLDFRDFVGMLRNDVLPKIALTATGSGGLVYTKPRKRGDARDSFEKPVEKTTTPTKPRRKRSETAAPDAPETSQASSPEQTTARKGQRKAAAEAQAANAAQADDDNDDEEEEEEEEEESSDDSNFSGSDEESDEDEEDEGEDTDEGMGTD
jgi:hypothetical protein